MQIGIGIGLQYQRLRGEPQAPPVNTVAPVASGVGIVSQTLSVTTGTWTGNPAPSFTYQWQRGGVDIGGATNNTYLLVAADAGQSIRAVVTADNGIGAPVSANSNAISVFASFTDVAGASASIAISAARLLRGAYYGSPIIRLRRSGDNAESDFGVGTDGLLDTGVVAWVVAGGGTQDAFLVTAYDQSGNARHFTNATTTQQAQMVSSGALITFGSNSRPTVQFDGTSDGYNGSNDVIIGAATPFTSFIVSRATGATVYKPVMSLKTSGNNVFFFYSSDVAYTTFSVCAGAGLANRRFPGAAYNANHLINYAYNGAGSLTTAGNFSARVNNASQVTASSAAVGGITGANMFGRSGDGSLMQGLVPEIIHMFADVTANYTALNGNINTFYGIY